MNIFFLSDEKFAEVFAVAVESLYRQHKHINDLRVFLIENKVSDESKEKLRTIEEKYARKIEYVPMPDIGKMIGMDLYIPHTLNMVDFARLFAADILPSDVDKVIQLDCDIIIRHSIDELWEMDLQDNYCAMINEGHSAKMRTVLNIPGDGMYFNSGVVPINLKKWREDKLGDKFAQYIKDMNGYIPVNAQGVMNAVMDGKIALIPLKYNVYTLMYAFEYKEFLKLRRPTYYYEISDYEEALKDPVVVHYMTCFYLDARPWMKDCLHPMTQEYLDVRKDTPWADMPLWDNVSKPIRRFYSKFCYAIPKALCIWISSIIYVNLIPMRHEHMKKKYLKNAIKQGKNNAIQEKN